MVVTPQIAIIYTTTPQKTAFEAGFTTLALIGGEGLYCLYYPLLTSEVAAVSTPQNCFLRKTVFLRLSGKYQPIPPLLRHIHYLDNLIDCNGFVAMQGDGWLGLTLQTGLQSTLNAGDTLNLVELDIVGICAALMLN